MKNILVAIDLQKDFINGALGTAEAVAMLPKAVNKIKGFKGDVLYTMDTHSNDYLSTREGRRLPVAHCIKGSDGWRLAPEIEAVKASDAPVFEKPTFGSTALASFIAETYGEEDLRIELIGLCTDICVISNAMLLKAALPEADIVVDSSCCAGVTPTSHQNALEAMKVCQIDII